MNRLGLALVLLDYTNRRNRRNNYDEMVERLESHIYRWKGNIEKIRSAKERVEKNVENNEERLSKAKRFFHNLNSEKSVNWYEKQKRVSENHKFEKVRASALKNITGHEEKLESVEKQIYRLKSWIEDGEERIESMKDAILDIEGKISSANSRI